MPQVSAAVVPGHDESSDATELVSAAVLPGNQESSDVAQQVSAAVVADNQEESSDMIAITGMFYTRE